VIVRNFFDKIEKDVITSIYYQNCFAGHHFIHRQCNKRITSSAQIQSLNSAIRGPSDILCRAQEQRHGYRSSSKTKYKSVF